MKFNFWNIQLEVIVLLNIPKKIITVSAKEFIIRPVKMLQKKPPDVYYNKNCS